MPATKITFLGVAAAVPEAGEETACFLVNDSILFDCGWCAALHMQQCGCNPLQVDTLIFTHCHHDHYLGLPALLFYRAMCAQRGQAGQALQIIGPADDLPIVYELACRFLQTERFPDLRVVVQLHPLEPGDTYETQAFALTTLRARHPVTGFCGRFTDKTTGAVIAFSGDTGPHSGLVELARHADVLIHEASLAPDVPDQQMRGDHSRATDAAAIARDAGVKQLRLIHLGRQRAASLDAARAIFPHVALAREGETIVL